MKLDRDLRVRPSVGDAIELATQHRERDRRIEPDHDVILSRKRRRQLAALAIGHLDEQLCRGERPAVVRHRRDVDERLEGLGGAAAKGLEVVCQAPLHRVEAPRDCH